MRLDKTSLILMLSFITGLITFPSVVLAGGNKLNTEQVMAHISGNTEQWSSGWGYYNPDGRLEVVWNGLKDVGSWEVDNDGQVCFVLEIFGPQKECHYYVKSGNSIRMIYDDSDVGSRLIKKGHHLPDL